MTTTSASRTIAARRVASARYSKNAANQLIDNLGRQVNLNNARNELRKAIQNIKNEIKVRYERGEFVSAYNTQQRRLESVLNHVNRKLRLRGPPIQRHFSLQNFSRINAHTNALKKYGMSAWNMYMNEVNKLMKKYHIPQSQNYHRKLAIKMIEANREARNQLARHYGLLWEMKTGAGRWKRRKTST